MQRATVSPGDHAARKRLRRSGREKGGHVYIPAELIGKLAEAPDLYYRLAGGERGRVVVTLYTEP
jgi:hypothetical protein